MSEPVVTTNTESAVWRSGVSSDRCPRARQNVRRRQAADPAFGDRRSAGCWASRILVLLQIGAGSNRELYEFLMGPQPANRRHDPVEAVRRAEQAGLEVIDLRRESLETVFAHAQRFLIEAKKPS
jgi:hypothetical protein